MAAETKTETETETTTAEVPAVGTATPTIGATAAVATIGATMIAATMETVVVDQDAIALAHVPVRALPPLVTTKVPVAAAATTATSNSNSASPFRPRRRFLTITLPTRSPMPSSVICRTIPVAPTLLSASPRRHLIEATVAIPSRSILPQLWSVPICAFMLAATGPRYSTAP